MNSFKELFPYKFVDLTEGFRYLGFYLNPTNYKVEDWCLGSLISLREGLVSGATIGSP
jgi:hypothetical protein